MSYVLIACRVLIGAVFLVSAVTKIMTRQVFSEFSASLGDMRLFRAPAVRPVAAAVAATELLVPILLIWDRTMAVAFACALALLIAFSVGIGRVLAAGTEAACLCFGISTAPFGRHHLVRNGILAAVAATGLLLAIAENGATKPPGVIIAAGVAVVLALIVVALDDLVSLFR